MKAQENELLTIHGEKESMQSYSSHKRKRSKIPNKFNNLPDDLKSLLYEKFYSINKNIQFSEITKQEFDQVLQNNIYFFKRIITLEDELENIKYETDIEYKDINPIKIDIPFEGTQFYLGNYNKSGKCHGFGIWTNIKNMYYGSFKNDEFHGEGLFINEKGDYYFGEWKNGKISGKGQLIQNNLVAYEGKFKNNQKNGEGIENFDDGGLYVGKFSKNQKDGKGKYIFSDGSTYEGTFKNSQIDGVGQILWADGKKYRGNFTNGKISGKGELQFENGIVFEGEFVNNRKQGKGEYKWPDGMTYRGKYLNNLPIGEGIYEDKTNNISEKIIYQSGKIVNNKK